MVFDKCTWVVGSALCTCVKTFNWCFEWCTYMMRFAQTYKCEKCTVQSGAYEECTHTDWCRDGAYLGNVHNVHTGCTGGSHSGGWLLWQKLWPLSPAIANSFLLLHNNSLPLTSDKRPSLTFRLWVSNVLYIYQLRGLRRNLRTSETKRRYHMREKGYKYTTLLNLKPNAQGCLRFHAKYNLHL